tara:strand:+ start:462 stop:2057 length:1596 start_codon:yes stop_codon:yes gene_type:complete
MSARDRVNSIVDFGSFKEIDRNLVSVDPISFTSSTPYKETLHKDQKRTGLTEAVLSGTCSIDGILCMIISFDFGFMGGSMGCAVGQKISNAIETAEKKKLPLLTIISGGGSRIQEGVLSLMQMAKTTIAVNRHNAKGLPFISVFSNPSTGQAFASFANLADITIAEPGAILGYNPIGTTRTENSSTAFDQQTSESHLEHGLIDSIASRTELREVVSVILDLLQKEFTLNRTNKRGEISVDTPKNLAWHSVQLARHSSRPTSLDYMARMLDNFVEIHGDKQYSDDPAISCGIGQLGGQTIVVIGQNRSKDQVSGNVLRILPEGFRKCQRAIKIARKFNLPIVSLIDTPGADTSIEAENRGLAHSIATTMSLFADQKAPTIAVVIGEGGSGGALSLGIADRVIMLENAIFSAISPEEAANLIYRDENRANEAAETLKLTAVDCKSLGIVDVIVSEPGGGAHTDHHESARLLKRALLQQLFEVQNNSARKRLRERYKKFKDIGEYSSYFRSTVTRELNLLQHSITERIKGLRRA